MAPPLQAATPLRIVVVDDFSALRDELITCLARPGRQLAGASCGQQLDALLRQQQFDVALLDVNLPGENGHAIAARLRARYPGMRLLMLTANSPNPAPNPAPHPGLHTPVPRPPVCDAWLHKPVDLAALDRLLDNACTAADRRATAPP